MCRNWRVLTWDQILLCRYRSTAHTEWRWEPQSTVLSAKRGSSRAGRLCACWPHSHPINKAVSLRVLCPWKPVRHLFLLHSQAGHGCSAMSIVIFLHSFCLLLVCSYVFYVLTFRRCFKSKSSTSAESQMLWNQDVTQFGEFLNNPK